MGRPMVFGRANEIIVTDKYLILNSFLEPLFHLTLRQLLKVLSHGNFILLLFVILGVQ